MWHGWTKNLYLLFDRDLRRVIGKAAELLAMDVFPAAVFVAAAIGVAMGWTGGWVALALATSFLLMVVRQGRFSRALPKIGFDVRLVNYQTAGAGLMALLLLNSARAHIWSGKIRWKGRGYSTGTPT